MPYPRYKDALTGGTGDVNPQFLVSPVSFSTAGTATQVVLPTQRLPAANRAQVLEILKIFIALPTQNFTGQTVTATLAAALNSIRLTLVSRNPGTNIPAINDTSIIADWWAPLGLVYAGAAGVYTNQGSGGNQDFVIDLTDGAGHGYIVGTDSVWAVGTSNVTFGTAPQAAVRIMYRWKDVSLAEYVGMVQQQS